MNGFMMSPIGFVIVAAYSAAILSVIYLLKRAMGAFRYRWWILVPLVPPTLVLLALPWAEEAWIVWHFNEACAGAGVKVYRQVVTDGYINDIHRLAPIRVKPGLVKISPKTREHVTRSGYRFIETLMENGKVEHVEDNSEGLLTTILDRPTTPYTVRFAYRPNENSHEEPIGWKLERVETQVVDSNTGEILGREIYVKRHLPIHEWLWVRYLGPGIEICPKGAQPPFPQSILKPVAY